jgi:hypothetical protein
VEINLFTDIWTPFQGPRPGFSGSHQSRCSSISCALSISYEMTWNYTRVRGVERTSAKLRAKSTYALVYRVTLRSICPSWILKARNGIEALGIIDPVTRQNTETELTQPQAPYPYTSYISPDPNNKPTSTLLFPTLSPYQASPSRYTSTIAGPQGKKKKENISQFVAIVYFDVNSRSRIKYIHVLPQRQPQPEKNVCKLSRLFGVPFQIHRICPFRCL